MNLHFIYDDKYTKAFIDYLIENNLIENNIFYVLTSGNLNLLKNYDCVKIIRPRKITFLYNLSKILHDKNVNNVFIHFLNIPHLIVSFMRKSYKLYWLLWGGDFYNHIDYPLYEKETIELIKINKKNLKEKFLDFLFRKAMKNRFDYVAINEIEYEIIKKYTKTKAERINFKYPNPVKENNKTEIIENYKNCCILAGNSGDPANNHISLINELSKLNKNFTVYMPLSYGISKEYINKVIEYGKKTLGDKFIPLVDFMNPDEYGKLLQNINICIMNHYRQQGAGNLRILLRQGCKVYLNEINPLYKYYTKNGIKLNKITKPFDEKSLFSALTMEEKIENQKNIDKIYSEENVYKYIYELFK